MASKAVLAAMCLFALTTSARAAETVAMKWADSQFTGALAASAERAAEQALAERAALTSKPIPPEVELKKGCAQEKACLAEVAKAAGVDHLLILRGRQTGPRHWVDGVWWEASSGTLRVHLERDLADPAEAARSVVGALIPPHARRGFAGLSVDAPAGVVVKVDGRTVGTAPLDAPLIVPAGRHSIDLLTPSGDSMLTNKSLAEGDRAQVSLALSPEAEAARRSGISPLRWTSYGLWVAGAFAIAGSLLSGKLSRDAEDRLEACTGGSRQCTSAAEARPLAERVDRYAGRANLLLGVGSGLSLAGVGLFTWTALDSDSEASSGAPSAEGSTPSRRAIVEEAAR